MNMTIDLKATGTLLIGIGIIILIIFLIVMVSHLIKTLKKTNRVLDDVQKITKIAAKRTEEVDGALDNVSESATELINTIKGQQDIKKAIATLVNLAGSAKTLYNKITGNEEKK